jgi:hypothetical protein
MEALEYACHGRSYFSTEGGRIGLGPLHTKQGDLVCIFYSGVTLYILRLKEGGGYLLIRESYVHGLMYGEAFEKEDREGDEFFTLE